jgi:hypothetical protein
MARRGWPALLPQAPPQRVMEAHSRLGRSQLAPPPGRQQAPRLQQPM